MKKIRFNKNLFKLFEKLNKKYSLAVANSIDETLNICLDKLKIKKFPNTILVQIIGLINLIRNLLEMSS